MAKVALNNGALSTTQIYLKQTERLAQMLSEYGDEKEAAAYLNEVEPIMQQTVRLLRVNSATGPSLPRRQSYDPPHAKPHKVFSSHNHSKDAYVNLTDVLPKKLNRHDSDASDATLKNLRRDQPRPTIAPKPKKIITASDMVENSMRRAGFELVLTASSKSDNMQGHNLRTNNEIISNGLENVRIRA